MIRCSGLRLSRKTVPDASSSGADSKNESVPTFSMLSAEVFLGWTSVGFQAPGVFRLPGARWIWKTIADVVQHRLCVEVRVVFEFLYCFGFLFCDGPPWKTSSRRGGGDFYVLQDVLALQLRLRCTSVR